MHPLILSLIGQGAIGGAGLNSLRRTTPVSKNPVVGKIESLGEGYAKRVKDVSGKAPLPVQLKQNLPTPIADILDSDIPDKEKFDRLKQEFDSSNFAAIRGMYHREPDGSVDVTKSKRGGYVVNINPNVPEELLAHELGHAAASQQSKVGDMVSRLRSDPKLAKALTMGGALTALGAGAITPGDEDLDEAIIGNLALASPTLIDEALASKNALAIMENAGRRADLGQRGRLAGAYLTYLAAPVSTAILANTLGNQLDEDV